MLPALPSTVQAGDTLAQTYVLEQYPAPGWVLTFTLISAAAKYTLAATNDGGAHALQASAAATAAWAPGTYAWVAHVASGGQRVTLNSGDVLIKPDLAAAATYDARTPAKKALDAVDAALAAYGAKAYIQTIQVGERQHTFVSPADFLKFRDQLRTEVQREESAARMSQGLGAKNRLLVRFTGR
jgi:hypothetical protein